MPTSVTGNAAAVLSMNEALYKIGPSNGIFSNQTDLLGKGTLTLVTYANQLTSINFGNLSDAGLASMVLNNILGHDASNSTALTAALTDLFAVNHDNRGVVIFQLTQLLAGLEGDATFGTAAKAWNATITADASHAQEVVIPALPARIHDDGTAHAQAQLIGHVQAGVEYL